MEGGGGERDGEEENYLGKLKEGGGGGKWEREKGEDQ